MRRKLTGILVVLCLGVLVSFAGEQASKKMDAAAHAAKLKAELGLTPEQTAQVEQILADTMKRIEPVRASIKATREELKALRSANPADPQAIQAKESELETLRAQKRGLKAERDSALKNVFTPEQFAKYQELLAAHKKEHGKHKK